MLGGLNENHRRWWMITARLSSIAEMGLLFAETGLKFSHHRYDSCFFSLTCIQKPNTQAARPQFWCLVLYLA
jgi:hypothetical protein